jgi:hypothetical protein
MVAGLIVDDDYLKKLSLLKGLDSDSGRIICTCYVAKMRCII